ncbi:unnamed protein product [Soboliphyme baturini]|uniref:TMEM132 domain-containing protein n=1 Tax=Soboliphyme baturini TaxID=241478 RepID=A0A183IP17_9BILA|nr:unnamed protein product [Soboliphyme baturini]
MFAVSTDNVLSESSAELIWEFSDTTESIPPEATYNGPLKADQKQQPHLMMAHPSGVKTRYTVKKDSLLDLIAVGKSQLINTASLTGSQASMPLKVLTVTRSGIVTDVTLMSSCLTMESSAVTPSCTAVYVDGSEVRGSINATIHVEYGDLKSLSHFTVWYPEFPVEIYLDDPVLHAIKGWRVAEHDLRKPRNNQSFLSVANKNSCRNRYQESQIRVYSRFRVDDLMTGMRAYLGGLGRQIQCDVTSLAKNSLRVADDRIAYIHVTASGKVIVEGIKTGRTEVQFLSPFSRVPYGATELEVTNDKVSIRKFQAYPLAKLDYSIVPHQTLKDNYILQVRRVRTFSKQYQNGAAKLMLEYSDGMRTDLHDLSASEFHLQIQAEDNNVIFLPADGQKLALFRYLILDETKRSSVRISFFVPEYCFEKDELPLFATSVVIESNVALKAWYDSAKNSEESTKHDGYFANHLVKVVVPTEPQNHESISEDTSLLPEPVRNSGGSKSNSGYSLIMNHSRGVKPTEIILYILVAVSLLVGIIFSLNCFMHSRHAKLKSLKPTCPRLPFPLRSFIFSRLGRETVMPAGQEFIWMRANTLTRETRKSLGCTDQLNNDSESNVFEGENMCDYNANSFRGRSSKRSSVRSTPAIACSSSCHRQTTVATAYAPRSFDRSSLYLGSEVCVHICPNPVLEVHCDQERRAASWNFSKSFPGHHHRCVITDSSSEQNISYASTAPRSAASRPYESHWDSRSLGMNETQLRDYFNSLRETVA